MIIMRESQTAVLERGIRVPDRIATEPFEVAWAGEARWFVQFLEQDKDTEFMINIQISPDGLAWTDHESPAITAPATTMTTIPVQQFGPWMRLAVRRVAGAGAPLMRIYLSLKE